MKINDQEVRYVADLANLALSEQEIVRMTKDLNGILEHIDKLNELDTSEVEPMAQVLYQSGETATLRHDEVGNPFSSEVALVNAPASGSGFYKVPRVIER